MQKTLAVITPTGDRHRVFELCCKYVSRQVRQPDEWIIVDDGAVPTDKPQLPYARYVRRRKNRDESRRHTLPMQMIEALIHTSSTYVAIMEDDDWYREDYLSTVFDLLSESNYELVGYGNTVYYNVPQRRYFVHDNRQHASWQQTAFNAVLIPAVIQQCRSCFARNDPYVDLRLWRTLQCCKKLLLDVPYTSVGMKGLPGRQGTCSGHRSTGAFKQDDEKLSFLQSLIGADVSCYEEFICHM